MNKITKIDFNWFYVTDEGTGCETREVGKSYDGKVVVSISGHAAQGEGDRWHYDINYNDGSFERIFNPNRVWYEQEVKP